MSKSRLERAARQSPGLFPFGTEILPRLTREEELTASFEVRLKSIWAYIVERAQRSVARMSGRERAHLDAEDLVDEIVCELLKKDEKWDPLRARYITFVGAVMRSVIIDERERARVVRAPANARARLERYRRLEAKGELKPGPRETMIAIRRCLGEVEAVHQRAGATVATVAEGRLDRRRELIEGLRGLGPVHALVLAARFGLFDGPTRTAAELGGILPGRPNPRAIRDLEAGAVEALKGRLQRIRDREHAP
jgi:DNA-directed RNA polymerase sigma subunit (sigma70/sigma32)